MEHAHSAGQASASGSTGAFSQPAPQAGFSSSVADESLHLVQGELPGPVAPGEMGNPQLAGASAAQLPASILSHWADVAPSENHHRQSAVAETSHSGTEDASGAQGSGISWQLLNSISETQPQTDTPHERSALDTTEPSVFDGVADSEPAEGSTKSPAPSEVEDQNREPESKQEQQQEASSAQEKESAHDLEKESAHDPERESAHDEAQAPGQSGKSDVLAHTMRQMEQSFGQDFGQVGVSPTLQSSEAGGAKAVATEEHIAYDPASVDLSSPEGKKILGHELSHIVQKRKGQVVSDAVDQQIAPESAHDEPHQSQHEPHGSETDQSSQRESLEQEADDAGERAANGQPAHVAAGAKAPRNQFFGLKDIGKFAKGAWNQTKKGVSGVWDTVKNADWKKIGKTTLDVATDFIPGISNVKDAYQAISGVNPVTGEKLGWGARIFSGICAIPGVGNIAKGIFKYGGKLLGKLGGKLLSKFGGKLGSKLLSKLGSLKSVGKSVWNGIKGVGKSVWNGAKGVGRSVWNGAKRASKWMGNKWKGAKSWFAKKWEKYAPDWLKKPARKVSDGLQSAKIRLLRRMYERRLSKATHSEAERIMKELSNKERGPVLSGVIDPRSGQIYYGRNTGIPKDLHPILQKRLDAYLKKTHGKTPERAAVPGSHSEINALDQALKAREKAIERELSEKELSEFIFHNVSLKGKRKGTVVPRCPNCKELTDGVTPTKEVQRTETDEFYENYDKPHL